MPLSSKVLVKPSVTPFTILETRALVAPQFGSFFNLENGWNFHILHGWLYAPSTNGESLWAWQSNDLGWWWTGLGVYPYIYSTKLEKWIYVDVSKTTKDMLTYYDYESKNWVELIISR